jgi:hypothetical protein
MHLAECEPESHADWRKTTHREATAAGAALCGKTAYMAKELYPDEEVWVQQVDQASDQDAAAAVELSGALGQAKARWDHADAPHHPELLALIRASERVLDRFRDGIDQ